uniref:Uncharacterized protein n=1 Tax=Arundo donax TaxID=35708 RepID=A0A0A9AYS3_ARUDO
MNRTHQINVKDELSDTSAKGYYECKMLFCTNS